MSERLTLPQALLSHEEVLAIAKMAHLDLSAEEVDVMTRELGHMLTYVKQLDELDLSAVAPTAHVQLERLERLSLRPDVPHESLPHALALREAPRVQDDGFAVPAFVDEG